MAVLKYKNADGQWETIPHVIHGSSGDGYELTDEDKNEIAGLVESVSYSQSQDLTDEQKATARQNIGVFSQDQVAQMIIGSFEEAVPKTDVVDNLVANNQFLTDKIPNGNAIQTFIENNAVSSVKTQSLSDSKKARARANIGAISQTELDEAIANADINGDYLSYSEAQELTDEQKELVRQNIGALEANAVVDSLVTSDNQFLPYNVPNGIAINDFATKYLIRCDVEQSKLTSEEKAQARANIGAVSQAELGSAVIDGIVVKDTTNSVDYIAKLRLVDGKPVIEYVEI